VLHHSTKEFTPYELTVSGKGTKMRPYSSSPADSAAPPESGARRSPPEKDTGGFPVLPPDVPQLAFIGDGMYRGSYRLSMAELIREMRMMVSLSTGAETNARILDKTGLTGRYEFHLEFAVAPPSSSDAARGPANGPDLFAALEKQLGLRLVKGKKISLDLLVIDSIDKIPTDN
jgi:uncharacterized protein (TIGR03435 family)